MLTLADKGGRGGLDPLFLVDIICEQPLMYIIYMTFLTKLANIPNDTYISYFTWFTCWIK